MAFLSRDQIWQRRFVLWWSLFAGVAVLWDFSWSFVFRHLQTPGIDHDWRIVWAVYGKVDERYLKGDHYLVVLEFLTGLGALLNFDVVYQLLRGTRRHALLALFAVSIMEIYGAVIYFGSEWLNDFANVDTASFVHTWVLFVGLNSLWVFIPSWCLYHIIVSFHRAEVERSAVR